MKKSLARFAVPVALALSLPAAANAAPGPATAALSQCLMASTTADDRVVLVDWIFSIIAQHPSVKNMVNISDAQRTDINKKTGALFTRLMIDSCGTQLKAAVEQDGTNAVQDAFGTLGEAAMGDLMGDSNVQAASNEMSAYFDEKRLEDLLGGKTSAAK